MIQPLIKLVLLCLLLFAGTLTVIHAQPYDDHTLRTFLDSDCNAPCLLGIQPGTSDLSAAQAILRDHPWVGVMRFARGMAANSGFMSWTWSGAQPAFIDGGIDGKLWIQDATVQWLEVGTRFRFGDLWLTRSPQSGRITPQSVEPRQVTQQADYDRIEARSQVACPLLPEPFWRAPLVFRLLGEPLPAVLPAYRLPRWQGAGSGCP